MTGSDTEVFTKNSTEIKIEDYAKNGGPGAV